MSKLYYVGVLLSTVCLGMLGTTFSGCEPPNVAPAPELKPEELQSIRGKFAEGLDLKVYCNKPTDSWCSAVTSAGVPVDLKCTADGCWFYYPQ